MEGLPNIYLTWNNPVLFLSCPRKIKLPEVQPLISQNFPLGSCFRWIFRFSVLKAFVDLPQLLWLYAVLLHTCLYFKMLRLNLLSIVTLFTPQGRSWRSPYQNQHNIDHLQIYIVKVNSQRDSNIVFPTVCSI